MSVSHTRTTLSVSVSASLLDKLNQYISTLDIPVTKPAVFRVALEQFLARNKKR